MTCSLCSPTGAEVPDPLVGFAAQVDRLPAGYSEGVFDGRRWGVTLNASSDRRRRWLWGEELGGTDRVSFNLYALGGDRWALRPCEMPAAKVIDFVACYCPDRPEP